MILEAIATVAAVQKASLDSESNVSISVQTASTDDSTSNTDTSSQNLVDQIQISEEAARRAAYAQYEAQVQQAELNSQIEQQSIDQNTKLASDSHQSVTVLPGLDIVV